MITAAQLRAARALVSLDQRALAGLAGLSLPTIQRMEASDGVVRGNVDSLTNSSARLKRQASILLPKAFQAPEAGGAFACATPPSRRLQSTIAIVAAAQAARDARRPVSAMRRSSPRPKHGGGVLAASPGRCGNRLRRIARAYDSSDSQARLAG